MARDTSSFFNSDYKDPNQRDTSELFDPDYQAPPAPVEEKQGDFMAGVYSGANSFMSLMNYSKAAIGALTDNEDWIREGIKTAEQYEAKAAEYGAGRVTDWDSVHDASDFVDYFQYGLGTLAPYAGESIVTGTAGAVAGSAMAPGAGTVTGTLGGMVAKQAMKEAIKQYAKKEAKGMSKEAIEKKIRKNFKEYASGKILPKNKAFVESAIKRTSAKMGATMGSMAGTYPVGMGDVGSNMIDTDAATGEKSMTADSAKTAAALAIPYAALDVLPEFIGISRLLNPAGGGMLKRTATGFVSQAPVEAATEVAQEEINIRTRAAHDPTFDPMGREAMVQRRESAILGGAGGGVFGAATGLASGKSQIDSLEADVSSNIRQVKKTEHGKVDEYNQLIIDSITGETDVLGDVTELSSEPLSPEEAAAAVAKESPVIGSERRADPESRAQPMYGSMAEKIDVLYNEALAAGATDSEQINQAIYQGLYGEGAETVGAVEQQPTQQIGANRVGDVSQTGILSQFEDQQLTPPMQEDGAAMFPVEQQASSTLEPIAKEDYNAKTIKANLRELNKLRKEAEQGGAKTVLFDLASGGGIDWDMAVAEGMDPKDMKAANRKGMPFGKPLFRKGTGNGFDWVAERLSEIGVTGFGQTENYDDFVGGANEALDLVRESIEGKREPVLMPGDEFAEMDRLQQIEQLDASIASFEDLLEEVDAYEQILSSEGQKAADDFYYNSRAMDAYAEEMPVGAWQEGDEVTVDTEFDGEGETLAELLDRASALNPEAAAAEFERLVDATDAEIVAAMNKFIGENTDETEQTEAAAETERTERDERPAQPSDTAAPETTQPAEPAGRRHEQKPVDVDKRKGERRRDSQARGMYEQMSQGELVDELIKHELTGIKNRRAFVVDYPYAEYVASIDADSLKWINDELSHEHGDALLQAVADALDGETDLAYHNSGDEFYVLGESEAEIEAVMQAAIARLKDAKIEAVKPDGTTITLNGLEITYAIAKDKQAADEGLASTKQAREQSGERAARGERPPQAVITDAEGNQLEGHTTAEEIDAAAHEAATSPQNGKVATEGQKEAGTYEKGHIYNLQGFDVSIENPAGSKRKPEWPVLPHHYGYFKGSIGADSIPNPEPHQVEHLDLIIKQGVGIAPDMPLYVVDQYIDGKFDEHKVVMGADSEQDAREVYQSMYQDGWKGLHAITKATPDQVSAWIGRVKAGPSLRKVEYAKLTESMAPEHMMVGVDDRELSEIVEEFNDFQKEMFEDGQPVTNIFVAPKKNEIVRLNDKVKVYHKEHGWMSPKEAAALIDSWEQNALDQYNNNEQARRANGDKVVLSLFDLSGKWSLPWEQAGYQVFRFDIQQDPEVGDVNNFSTEFFGDWFGDFEGKDIYAILAACPCTDFAVSGARHFAAKDADGRTVASVNLVHQTLRTIEYFKPQIWAIENPVGRIEKLGGLPPWRLSFDPNHLGEDYTKKTLIWGRFNADLPIAPTEPTEGSKMHKKYGGKSLATKNARSATPDGFAYAFFQANNAHDHPIIEVANKFDRLNRDLIQEALDAGVTPEDINEAVEDFYYMEMDDMAAEDAISLLIEDAKAEAAEEAAPAPKVGAMAAAHDRYEAVRMIRFAGEVRELFRKSEDPRTGKRMNPVSELGLAYREYMDEIDSRRDAAVDDYLGEGWDKYSDEYKALQEEADNMENGSGLNVTGAWENYLKQNFDEEPDGEHFATPSDEDMSDAPDPEIEAELNAFEAARKKYHKDQFDKAAQAWIDGAEEVIDVTPDERESIMKKTYNSIAKLSEGKSVKAAKLPDGRMITPTGIMYGDNPIMQASTLVPIDSYPGEKYTKAEMETRLDKDERLRGSYKGQIVNVGSKKYVMDKAIVVTGRATPAGDLLAGVEPEKTMGEQTVPLPYASGMSRPGDFKAALAAGGGVGVEINELSKNMMELVSQAIADGHEIFVDSGAFRAFMAAQRNIEKDLALDDVMNFDEVMDKYKVLLDKVVDKVGLGDMRINNLMFVMPDVVGDQAATMDMIGFNMGRIQDFTDYGATVIIPMQRGELSQREAFEQIHEAMDDAPWVPGIPSNAAALSDSEFRNMLSGDYKPSRLHILGAAKESSLFDRMNVIREMYQDSEITVTADANLIRSQIDELKGKNRSKEITRIINENLPELWKRRSFTGDTDMFGDAHLQTDIEQFTGKPDNRSKDLEQLRKKLEGFTDAELKKTLKGSGLKQVGDKAAKIKRLLDAREAADVFSQYDTLRELDEAVAAGEIDKNRLQAWADATHPGKNQTSPVNTQLNSKIVHSWGVKSGALKMESGWTEAAGEAQLATAEEEMLAKYPKEKPIKLDINEIGLPDFDIDNLPLWLVAQANKVLRAAHKELRDIGYMEMYLRDLQGDTLPDYLKKPVDTIHSIEVYVEKLNNQYGRFMKGHKNVSKNQLANTFGRLAQAIDMDFDNLYKLSGLEKEVEIAASGGRWYVSGEPGVDPRAGELGISLGYVETDEGDRVKLRFDDGKEELFTVHQLLPESAAPRVDEALDSEEVESAFDPVIEQLPADVRKEILSDTERLNPKVEQLVLALNKAGIRTTMSGDLYEDQLVYVDVAPEHFDEINMAELPDGWINTHTMMAATKYYVLDEQMNEQQNAMFENFIQVNKPIRLARKGADPVTAEEAQAVADSIVPPVPEAAPAPAVPVDETRDAKLQRLDAELETAKARADALEKVFVIVRDGNGIDDAINNTKELSKADADAIRAALKKHERFAEDDSYEANHNRAMDAVLDVSMPASGDVIDIERQIRNIDMPEDMNSYAYRTYNRARAAKNKYIFWQFGDIWEEEVSEAEHTMAAAEPLVNALARALKDAAYNKFTMPEIQDREVQLKRLHPAIIEKAGIDWKRAKENAQIRDYRYTGLKRGDTAALGKLRNMLEQRNAVDNDPAVTKELSAIKALLEPEIATAQDAKNYLRGYPETYTKAPKKALVAAAQAAGFENPVKTKKDLLLEQLAEWNRTGKTPEQLADEKPAEKPKYGADNKLVSQDDYAEIQRKLKEKLGRLNSGIDPEIITLGTQAAVYHIEAGARSFAAFSKAMVKDFGDTVKPYLRSWYEAARYYPGADAEGMSKTNEIELYLSTGEEYAAGQSDNLEPDSGVTTAGERLGGANVPVEPGASDPYVGGSGQQDEQSRVRQQVDTSLPDSIAALPGTDGNLELFESDGTVRAEAGVTGDTRRTGSRPADAEGVPAGRKPDRAANEDAKSLESEHSSLRRKQRNAADLPVKLNDSTNIDETLPVLFPEQRGDVGFAEKRFFTDNKKGVLFTNGTGTGKTYTGLGVAKRFHQRGKKRILIVVPTDAKAKDWIEDGHNVDLNIKQLSGIQDAGTDAVVTTYANFRDNTAIVADTWDLVIYDESHYLMSNKAAERTAAMDRHHEITNHPDGYYRKAQVLTPEWVDVMERETALVEKIKKEAKKLRDAGESKWAANNKAKARFKDESAAISDDIQAARKLVEVKNEELRQLPDNVKVVMLSATPFAYDKNIDYAEGYLFDYPAKDPSESIGYNVPNGREQFFIEHFGYRMRYNKLTEPEAEVNRDLMERQFHQWLRDQGALSGRALAVENDYSRQFIEVQSGIGEDIDRGYQILTEYNPDLVYKDKNGNEHTGRDEYPILGKMLRKRFDYHYTNRLLEAIKTHGAIQRAKQHIAIGRKVVVFHSYNEGQPSHPFIFEKVSEADIQKLNDEQREKVQEYNAEVERFNSENPDILALDLKGLVNPIVAFSKEFGDRVALFNGRIPKKQRRMKLKEFNRDGSGTDVILVQMEAGKEGLSAHDVTGTHQRVMMQLGLPVKPVDAIQTEGRIFRLGVKSHAIFEYMKVGTSMESFKFGTTISQRSRTAENLALGDSARDMERAFIEAYMDSTAELPSDNQGTGSKASDMRVITESAFDAAISFYFGQQKRTSKNKAREGKDYFATPEPLGQKMVEWAHLAPNEKALEPSAGHGAISRFFPEEARVMAVEPSNELYGRMSLYTRGNLVNGRFEDVDLHNKFNAIVMNPPFGTGGKQAMEHIAKAFKHLRNGGRIIAIIPEGNSMAKRLDKWYESKEAKHAYQMREIKLPAITFKRAGTAVNARIVIIDKYTNVDEVPPQKGTIDLSSYNNINDFFDAIRDMDMDPRGEVKEVETEETEEAAEAAESPAAALFSGRDGKLPSQPAAGTAVTDAVVVKGAEAAGAKLVAGTHTKHGYPIWTVTMENRVDRSVYMALKEEAKFFGGRYSTYKGNGAIPGFIFRDEEKAKKFMGAFGGVAEQGAEYGVEAGKAEYTEVDAPEPNKEQLDIFTENKMFPGRVAQFGHETEVIQSGTFDITIDKVTTPEQAASIMRPLAEEAAENFATLVLDAEKRPIAVLRQFFGTVDGASVYPREVATLAHMITDAEYLWFSHNHPSGVTDPSHADKQITNRLEKSLEGSGISVEGHVIVGYTDRVMATGFDSIGNQYPFVVAEKPAIGTVPEYRGRKLTKFAKPGEALTSPAATRGYLTDKPEGIHLLNNRNQVIGYAPLTMEQVGENTTGKEGWRAELIRIIGQSNAAAIIVKTNEISDRTKARVTTFKDAAAMLDVRVLDMFDPEGKSAAEQGILEEPAVYLQRGKAGIGMRVSQVQKVVDRVLKQYKGAAAANIVVRKDDVDAYGAKIEGDAAKGGFDPRTNTVSILAHNMNDEADVMATIRHELFTHFGLRQLFSATELQEFLDLVIASRKDPEIAEIYESVNKSYPELFAEPYKQAEEVVARIAERHPKASLLDKIRALFNRVLRRLGLSKGLLTVSEINTLIDKSAANLKTELYARNIRDHADDIVQVAEAYIDKAVGGDKNHLATAWASRATSYNVDANYAGSDGRGLRGDERIDYVTTMLKREIVKQRMESTQYKTKAVLKSINDRLTIASGLVKELESLKTGIMRQVEAPVLYSQMLDVLRKKLPNKGQVGQFKLMINNMAAGGNFKLEELQWSGLNEWLDDQSGKIEKNDVLKYVYDNQVQIREKMLTSGAVDQPQNVRQELESIKTDLAAMDIDVTFNNDGVVTGVDWLQPVQVDDEDTEWSGYQVWEQADQESRTDADELAQLDIFNNEDDRERYEGIDTVYGEGVAAKLVRLGEIAEEMQQNLEDNDAIYVEEQLPGGENYRELLLMLPVSAKDSRGWQDYRDEIIDNGFGRRDTDEVRRYLLDAPVEDIDMGAVEKIRSVMGDDFFEDYRAVLMDKERRPVRENVFRSGHWNEKNVMAHVRFNERIDADGKRVLFIEEVQSDWHQGGRDHGYRSTIDDGEVSTWWSDEGGANESVSFEDLTPAEQQEARNRYKSEALYGDESVPDAPFKKSWPMVVMKRMIRYATDNGFDRIAWTTGQQQNDRYSLDQYVKEVAAKKDGDNYLLVVEDKNGLEVTPYRGSGESMTPEKLRATIGVELANRLMAGADTRVGADWGDSKLNQEYFSISGLDLNIGGSGMIGFYDKMLPSMVNKYVKKWGGKVGETTFNSGKDELDNYDVHSLDITDKMRAAVTDGQVMFQRSDPDYEAARAKVGKKGHKKTILDYYKEISGTLGLRFRQGVVDRYAALMRLDDKVWKLARSTHHVGGAVEAAFKYGKISLDEDGAIDVDVTSKGLSELLAPLGHEIDDFLFWMIGNRANNLMAEDREHLFTEDEIAAFMRRNEGTMSHGRNRAEVYEQARKDLMEFQESILEIGIKTDTISREEADTWNKEFYIPFYRILEDEDGNESTRGAQTLDGLTGQTAIKRLKGGTKNLNDPLANILMNWHHVLSASLKNQAATATVVEAADAGLIKPVSKKERSRKAFFVRVNGEKRWFDIEQDVENPIVPPDLVLEALTMLNQPMWNNAGMRAIRKFKRWFTIGVTASPEFRIANLIRDSLHSVAVGKQNYNVFDNIYQGWKGTEEGSDVEKRMMAGGGTIHFGLQYGDDPEAARMLIEEHIDAETVLTDEHGVKKYRHALKGLWTLWRDFGNKIENVNRAALYQKRMAEGATHFEASHEARDLMDFFQSGSWPAVRFLTQSVPFLNARLQGLDKMYRAGITPEQKKQLYIVLGAYITATLALYLLWRDDEDFKAREEWDRDSYHWFKAPGTDIAFRIPKPFEVGAIGTMAERALEFAIDDDAHGDLLAERLGHVFWQTFEFDPVPQIARPLLNVYANKDPFTNRPIESVGMERLSPNERKYAYTSETAIAVSKAYNAIAWEHVELSPIQLEYLLGGYLGWAGSFSLGAIDNLITRPVYERELPFLGESRPERGIDEWPITRRFVQKLPVKRTKYTTMFYENLREINQVYADMANYRKLGELEKAREIVSENRDTLGMRKIYNSASKKLTQINNQMRRVRGNKKLTAKQKKAEIDRLRGLKNAITERIIKVTAEKERSNR